MDVDAIEVMYVACFVTFIAILCCDEVRKHKLALITTMSPVLVVVTTSTPATTVSSINLRSLRLSPLGLHRMDMEEEEERENTATHILRGFMSQKRLFQKNDSETAAAEKEGEKEKDEVHPESRWQLAPRKPTRFRQVETSMRIDVLKMNHREFVMQFARLRQTMFKICKKTKHNFGSKVSKRNTPQQRKAENCTDIFHTWCDCASRFINPFRNNSNGSNTNEMDYDSDEDTESEEEEDDFIMMIHNPETTAALDAIKRQMSPYYCQDNNGDHPHQGYGDDDIFIMDDVDYNESEPISLPPLERPV